MTKVYRIEIWCSDDSCTEFWFDKPLSPFYAKKEMALTHLQKYDGLSSDELCRMANVIEVCDHKPKIVEYDVLE